MSSRPTPFGLFSGISIGDFSNETEGSLSNINQFQKRTRPDMEWLLGIVDKIEKNYEFVMHLKVKSNEGIYKMGERVFLSYFSNCGQMGTEDEKIEQVSVRNTIVIEDILKASKYPITFEKLIESIQKKYPQASIQKIGSLVWKLFEKELLISELRPPFINTDPFHYIRQVLRKIPQINQFVNQLDDIHDDITHYDRFPVGDGIQVYLGIVEKMKRIHDSRNPLQVDLKMSTKEPLTINKSIKDDACNAVEYLWRMSDNKMGWSHLRGYHIEFLEKYGQNREMPLLDLLSEEKGLGPPPTYKQTTRTRNYEEDKDQTDNKKNQLLMDKYLQCIKNNQTEIELTDFDKSILFDYKTENQSAPDSGEVFIKVLSPSSEEIDNGNYVISIGDSMVSQELGQTFGRFSDMLIPSVRNQIINEQHSVKNQFTDDQTLFVEASFLPNYGRSSNVEVTFSGREYQFVLGTNAYEQTEVIPPEDILVGATFKGFYLKSKKLNKQLIVTSNNMLNYESAPNSFRFLREVSMENTKPIQPFNWGSLKNLSFLPRIKIGRVIVSPAVWKLDNNHPILADDTLSFKGWVSKFTEWKEEMNIPQFVRLTYGDNSLSLDLCNLEHLRIVQKELRKKETIQLKEDADFYWSNQWLNGDKGNHSVELVIPFKKRKDISPRPSINFEPSSSVIATLAEREKEPGTEWLYFKIYVPSYKQEEFISQNLYNLISNLKNLNLIDSWFYIRYKDLDPHIRLRLKGDPKNLMQKVLPRFQKWYLESKQNGNINSFTINIYEREIERYGGLNLISSVEDYFESDSYLVMNILNLEERGELPYSLTVIAAIDIIYFLNVMGWSYEEQLDWIMKVTDKYLYSDEFRDLRKELIKIASPENNWEALSNLNYPLRQSLSERDASIVYMSKKMKENRLTNTPEGIIGSLIHMHCNRLFGVDQESEKKAMAFVRHTLHSQKHWKRKISYI